MKSITKKFSWILSIFAILIIASFTGVSQPLREAEGDIYEVIINEAYYIENDVYIEIITIVSTDFTNENYYLQVILTNPIGVQYSVVVRIITSIEVLTLEFIFYNCATEPGDYTVDASIINNYNGGWYVVTDTVVFDPPGGSGGDLPTIGIRIV